METIAAPLDWLGVNYYTPSILADDPDGPLPHAREVRAPRDARRTLLQWEIRAEGREQVLVRVTRDYAPERIYVTENGSAWADTVAKDGQVHDPERALYLEEHLAVCGRAVKRGVPLAGYFAWSLLDNFEWADGYEPRFGLVYVDFETQRRLVKDSGARYAKVIRSHHDGAPLRNASTGRVAAPSATASGPSWPSSSEVAANG